MRDIAAGGASSAYMLCTVLRQHNVRHGENHIVRKPDLNKHRLTLLTQIETDMR